MDNPENTEGLVSAQPAHVLDQLAALLANQLPDEQRLQVETHLQECDECRARFQELAQVPQEPPVIADLPAPESFNLSEYGQSTTTPASSGKMKWVVLVALLAIGGASGFLFMGRRTHPMKMPTPMASPPVQPPPMARPPVPPPSIADGKVTAPPKDSLVNTLSNQFGKPAPVMETPHVAVMETKPAPVAPKPAPAAPVPKSAPVAHTPAVKPVMTAKPMSVAKPKATPVKPVPVKPVVTKPAPVVEVAAKPAAPKPASAPIPGEPESAKPAPAPAKLTADPVATPSKLKDGLPEWQGVTSGITQPMLVVIHDAQEWEYLWKAHYQLVGTPTSLPDLDFNQYVVVGVFAGEKPTNGYSVMITGTEQTPTSLIVNYSETGPAAGAAKPTTQPYHLKALRKSPLSIQFKKN